MKKQLRPVRVFQPNRSKRRAITAMNKRIEREKRTVSLMIGMFCKKHHTADNGFCEVCLALFDYAEARTNNCKFGSNKPICAKCPVHCYKPDKREEIKKVMRFAGPRMIYTHPYLAMMHIFDKNRSKQYERTNK